MSINAFVGIESYDIVLYLSRVLVKLNKKVLLIDVSRLKELSACISVPKTLDISKGDIVNYRGIDCTETIKKLDSYDYVYLYMGDNYSSDNAKMCQNIFCVTDMQKHNIDYLLQINLPNESNKFLIVRDIVDINMKADYLEKIRNKYYPFHCFLLNYEMDNTKAKLSVMYHNTFLFKRISKELKELISYIFIEVIGIDKKLFVKAYKLAERGK